LPKTGKYLGLEALQDHAINSFYLFVRMGVGHSGPVYTDVVFIAKFQEFVSGKLCTVVHHNRDQLLEAMDDVGDEPNGLVGGDLRDGLHLDPLGELVTNNQNVRATPGCLFQGSDQIKSPDCERQHDEDCLEHLCG
jgi:hypothetical protein